MKNRCAQVVADIHRVVIVPVFNDTIVHIHTNNVSLGQLRAISSPAGALIDFHAAFNIANRIVDAVSANRHIPVDNADIPRCDGRADLRPQPARS